MYTVIIVDDEEPVLESFLHMMNEGIEGFLSAGVARNGYDAITMIFEKKPDVVFMDINMPGIDGLEAISRIHTSVPDTIFILSTAYERFDIARRAIPLKIHSYLVKPVTKKTFIETLQSVRTRLDQERPKSSCLSSRSFVERDLMERAFLCDELSLPISPARWEELRAAFSLDSDKALIAFVGIDDENEKKTSILYAVNDLLSKKYCFLWTFHLGQALYFISGEVRQDQFTKDISDALTEIGGNDLVRWIGIGESATSSAFHTSYALAFSRLRNGRARTEALARERLAVASLRQKLGYIPPEEFMSTASKWTDALFSSFTFEEAKIRLVTAIVLLNDDLTGFYKTGEFPELRFDPAGESIECTNLYDISRWAQTALYSLASEAHLSRSANLPVPLSRAISFIATHFQDPIQLSDAADAASISSAYLSRIFGEFLHVSFVEYLTSLRIDTAERLLRERKLSVKEVSHAVGFQDPNYFSKAFRKHTGLSPSTYAGQEHEE